MKSDQRRPLSYLDTELQTVGCRISNPNNCKNNSTEGKCAFVRESLLDYAADLEVEIRALDEVPVPSVPHAVTSQETSGSEGQSVDKEPQFPGTLGHRQSPDTTLHTYSPYLSSRN